MRQPEETLPQAFFRSRADGRLAGDPGGEPGGESGGGEAGPAGQFGIDLVAGFRSADRGGMDAYFARIQDVPGVDAAFYSYGPLLFFAGQLALVTLLAAGRRVRPWAPVLVLAEIILPLLDKDFIPLGAALLLVASAPLLRRDTVPRSTSDPVGAAGPASRGTDRRSAGLPLTSRQVLRSGGERTQVEHR
ncbi:hypothetical protein [Amycolatopsis sp. CA-126428]|uniref:hypothetical protein n=1 Tax=Amycolatopsis sp. CA-126428 TaxID=2073158 RepID=UPI001E57729B|nr:hypothetical protein [Amycolatopsis sp. CA-126428]